MRRAWMRTAAVLLFVAAAALLSFPAGQRAVRGYRDGLEIRTFEENKSQETDGYVRLRESMEEYNRRIFTQGQSGLSDAWDYEKGTFDFGGTGLDEEMIGYISIPAMDIRLPLYIGASEENLMKGAAVLAQTSMPLGGEDTNCVIAGHRGGYFGQAVFRDIEVLRAGDTVEITNLWETLEYEVVKCIVISPDDLDAVKIRPGRDMVTLVTCHPYTHNYQRYVVYCSRSGQDKTQDNRGEEAASLPYGLPYEPSGDAVRREDMLTEVGLIVLGAAAVFGVAEIYRRRKGRRKSWKKTGKTGKRI